MIKRIVGSLIILVMSGLVAVLTPVDLVRRPPGSVPLKMPTGVTILSCHGVPPVGEDGARKFTGTSMYGPFWQWRQGLDQYDQLNVGPRDTELERASVDEQYSSYLVYKEGDVIRAVIYGYRGSPDSGSIAGRFTTYDKDAQGRWRSVAMYDDSSSNSWLAVARLNIITACVVAGALTMLAWNMFISRRKIRAPTIGSSVPLTRGTPAAYAPAAPRVAVRSLRSFDGSRRKMMRQDGDSRLCIVYANVSQT
jgi:hypothetical protein